MLPPLAEVGLVLLGIVDLHDGIQDVLLLALGRLAEDLLGGYLDGRRGAILHPGLVLAGHGDCDCSLRSHVSEPVQAIDW